MPASSTATRCSWGQFAASGDPNGPDLPDWRSFNDGCIQYLVSTTVEF